MEAEDAGFNSSTGSASVSCLTSDLIVGGLAPPSFLVVEGAEEVSCFISVLTDGELPSTLFSVIEETGEGELVMRNECGVLLERLLPPFCCLRR